MGWSRGSRAFTVLLLISAVGCDGREPLAPSFMFVGAPGSFTATAVAFNQINLTWQDNSTNETGFEVYQSTTGPAGSFSFPGHDGTTCHELQRRWSRGLKAVLLRGPRVPHDGAQEQLLGFLGRRMRDDPARSRARRAIGSHRRAVRGLRDSRHLDR